jgi:hypothetical protein
MKQSPAALLLFIAILLTSFVPKTLVASDRSTRCFYIDAQRGSDANNGLSPSRPWRSLQKVNSTSFLPGDKILFRSSCHWKGQLRPKGSGMPDRPICIDSYGKGSLPEISQADSTGIVLLLLNQDQWEIRHLCIDGGTAKPTQQVGGIHVQATTAHRILRHIVISDCTIRHTLGSIKQYESSAIWVGVPGWNDKNGLTTGFDDVRIENNMILGSDRNGILVWTTAAPGPHSQFQKGLIHSCHVVIRNNLLEDIGGDGILVLGSDQPLIEHNVVRRCCTKVGDPAYGNRHDYNPSSAAIWLHHCSHGVMQHNAVYDCQKLQFNNDGMAYDFDYNCDSCLLQYNYSCNNAGGFLLIMNTATNNIARFNISLNDRSHFLYCVGRREENNQIYNNSFSSSIGKSYIVPNAYFTNNIFQFTDSASVYVENPAAGSFSHNCYAGNWTSCPPDDHAVSSDPLFVTPPARLNNTYQPSAFRLRASSPCIAQGKYIEHNGDKDFLGHALASHTLDIGAVRHK